MPIVHGHTIYIDSEWALTSISQAQFWPDVDLGRYGDGTVQGILSVDVSDWDTPGGAPARWPRGARREEIRAEVWGQLTDHLNDAGQPVLDESGAGLVPRSGDRVPQPDGGDQPRAAPDQHRRLVGRPPERTTRIPNLMLAADYVRTNTDLATMEGANEAARRAVNAILDATGSPAPRCDMFASPSRRSCATPGDSTGCAGCCFRPARPPLTMTPDGGRLLELLGRAVVALSSRADG